MSIINNSNSTTSILYIKRICTNCGYKLIPVDNSEKCDTCNHHWREYLNYLEMKRGIESCR